MKNEDAYTAILLDGTKAPNKLGDAVKTLRKTRDSLKKQIHAHKYHLPDDVVANMRRQISAIECALPVLLWELDRRKGISSGAEHLPIRTVSA